MTEAQPLHGTNEIGVWRRQLRQNSKISEESSGFRIKVVGSSAAIIDPILIPSDAMVYLPLPGSVLSLTEADNASLSGIDNYEKKLMRYCYFKKRNIAL